MSAAVRKHEAEGAQFFSHVTMTRYRRVEHQRLGSAARDDDVICPADVILVAIVNPASVTVVVCRWCT